MTILKADTAATVKMGPFVDETDGVTAETGLTIAQADIRLSKNGGDFAQTNNATGATHDENGYYGVPLDTTDTNTEGRLRVAISESGALPVWEDFMVVNANVYDSLYAAATTDYLQVDSIQISGDATAANNAELAFDGTGYAFANCTLPWNSAWDAEVQSECNDALVNLDLDHLANTTAGASEPTDGTWLDQIMHKGAGQTFDPTTDSLEALRDSMQTGIPKNTGFNNIEFLMVDSSDHRTGKTGLTVSGQRSIDGGAFSSVTGSIAEVGSGIYQFDASAADTNGDIITYRFYATGADDTFITIKTSE